MSGLAGSQSLPVLLPASYRSLKPLPGVGSQGRLHIGPRRGLQVGGGGLGGGANTRVGILLRQVGHVAFDVQRAAVQELSMLASSSETIRMAILSSGGTSSLLKMMSRTESYSLLRWCFSTLSALAADETSRNEQSVAIVRLYEICQDGAVDDDNEQQHMLLEAAFLLANLIQASGPRAAFEALGGLEVLLAAAAAKRSQTSLKTLQLAGIAPPSRASLSQPLKPLGAIKAAESKAAAAESKMAAAEAAYDFAVDDATMNAKAAQVQASVRGHRARGEARRRKQLAQEEHAAAARMQSRERGRQTRNAHAALAASKREEAQAATRVQASIRGRQSRAAHSQGKASDDEMDAAALLLQGAFADVMPADEMDAAALLLQGAFADVMPTAAAEPTADAVQAADDAVEAAIKVQAGIRGRQARAKLGGSAAPTPEAAAALAAEAAAADEAVNAAVRVQASIRGRQVRARKPGAAATPAGAAEATAEATAEAVEAAEDAVNAAIKVQAGIRGRQARAKMAGSNVTAEATAALEAEASAAEEAVKAAVKVQAGIRGRQVRAARKA